MMRGFARDLFIYGLGGAASRLAAIFLIPLYTRSLTIDEYGQLEALLAIHTLSVLFVGLQSESAVARDFFDARGAKKLPGLLWSGLAISVGGAAGLAALSVATAWTGLWPSILFAYWIGLLAIALPAQLLGIQQVCLRFAGSPWLFATVSFLDLALSALFSAVFILWFNWGVAGALAGIGASKTICVLIAWPKTFAIPTKAQISRALLVRMLKYALPTMPSVFINWLQTNGNRVLLLYFLTLKDLALAGLAMKIAALYGFLAYIFRLVWEPYAFRKLSSNEGTEHVFNRVLKAYLVIMFFIAGLTALLGPVIGRLLAPPEYASASSLVAFFIFGQFWIGSVAVLSIGIHGARLTSRLTYIAAGGVALNLFCLVFLSNLVGVYAAAAGFLVGSIVSALIATYFSDKLFHTRFDWRVIGAAILSTIVMTAYLSWLGVNAKSVPFTAEKEILMWAQSLLWLIATGGVIIWAGGHQRFFRDFRQAYAAVIGKSGFRQ